MSLLSLYHHLPYPARVVAASLRGYYLSLWRYNSQTDALVEDALDRENWSNEKWIAWQSDQLARALDYAAKNVPYYRHQWSERRQKGDRASWERLEDWPVLKKKVVRENPKLFVSDEYQSKSLFLEHTSGTTGTPLPLFQSREAITQWYALFEARWRRWNGVDRKIPWAILGGQLVVPGYTKSPPFWVWNQAFRQLYLSSYHLTGNNIKAYLVSMIDHGIKYLYGYPSSMTVMAQFAREISADIPELKVIISNAEPLFNHQRELLQSVFGCPVKNTYGMSEIVCGASECDSGNLHLWPDAGVVEVLRDNFDIQVSQGEPGRIVATGFLNNAMPLIRYEVGDSGSLGGTDCTCGRHMRVLKSIEGRTDDLLLTSDGRRVGRLDPVFKTDYPIIEAQIVQESLDHIVVNLVPAKGFTKNIQIDLSKRIQDRLGPVNVEIREMVEIPKGPNGKFRAVISKLEKT